MLGVEPIETMVKYTLMSGWVKNGRPLSLMVVGASGIGKSEIITQFKHNDTVLFLNALSRWGLYRDIAEKLQTDKLIKSHFMLPDLSQTFISSQLYLGDTIAAIMTLTEEGLYRVSTKYINLTSEVDKPIRLGCITAVVKQHLRAMVDDPKSLYSKAGFFNRFIPVSYKYDDNLLRKVNNFIADGNEPEPVKVIFPLNPIDVECKKEYVMKLFSAYGQAKEVIESPEFDDDMTFGLSPATEAPRIDYFINLASKEQPLPRFVRMMRHLLQAIALTRSVESNLPRAIVNDDDVKELIRLSHWINTRCNQLKDDQNQTSSTDVIPNQTSIEE